MYVRALKFECRDNVSEREITDVYRELIDTATGVDGFEGSTLLMCDDGCRGMALIFWRDRDAASEASTKLLPILAERIHDVLENPPDIVGYNLIDRRFTGEK